jgi:membrane-bound lytic murein transglycosylase D
MIRILFLFVGVGLLSMSAAMGIHPIKQGADAYVLSDEMSAVFTDPETAVLPDSLEGPGETDTPPGVSGPGNTDTPPGASGPGDTDNPQDTTGTASDTTTVAIIGPDDPIVAMLDSLAALAIFRNLDLLSDSGVVRKHGFPPDFVPTFADSVYRARIERMNGNSPMEFVYNAWVKSYIELYGMRRRQLTERMLGLGTLYFPFFEEQLDRHNIPLEMKYLAVIESALNPTARSRAGAGGMWQFMYHTGRLYGLQVNSFVDDRNDVTLSTIAASRHLADLYEIYEDWWLVLAAYNAGPGNVNRAIRRAGGVRDYWLIRPYLPSETRNYVPAFIAVAYVMTHAEEHNLYPVPPLFSFHDTDTVMVRQQISLRTVSDLLDVPLDHLRFLNPAFRQNIIPYREENPYALTLPTKHMGVFLANEDTIYNFRTPDQVRQEELASQMAETTVHVVRQGDVLGSIARRYGTTVREIQQLNNLRGTLIRPGQRLIVRATSPPPAASGSGANVHVVSRGETLGIIANRYRISINNLMQWNNLTGSVIHPGQQLIVRPPSGS